MGTKDALKGIIREQISTSVSTFFLDKIMTMIDESADNKASFLAVAEKIGNRISMFIDTGLAMKVAEGLKAEIEKSSSPAGIRRQHLRVPLAAKVKVTFRGTSYDLDSETISNGGIYLRKDDPFPVGSEVGITLPIGAGNLIHLKGVVVYTNIQGDDTSHNHRGMAIEFRGVNDEELRNLRYFVGTLSAQAD